MPSPAAHSTQGRLPTSSLQGPPFAHMVMSPLSSDICLSVKTPAVHSEYVIWPLEGRRGVSDGTCGNYMCFMCKVIIYTGVSCPLVPSTALYVGGASYSPVHELRGSDQLSRAVDDTHLLCKLSSWLHMSKPNSLGGSLVSRGSVSSLWSFPSAVFFKTLGLGDFGNFNIWGL